MSHMIPTLSPPRDTVREREQHMPKHRRLVGSHAAEDSLAACTGGLVSPTGRRLRHCRSSVCPQHQPEGYAQHNAKHDRDLTLNEMLAELDDYIQALP